MHEGRGDLCKKTEKREKVFWEMSNPSLRKGGSAREKNPTRDGREKQSALGGHQKMLPPGKQV